MFKLRIIKKLFNFFCLIKFLNFSVFILKLMKKINKIDNSVNSAFEIL